MRTLLRILVSPLRALLMLAVLGASLATFAFTQLAGAVTEIKPVKLKTARSTDTPLLMALLAQAVNLGLGVAVYVGILQQSSVSSVEALVTPMVTAFVSFLISALHGHFAQRSYAVQAANGLLPQQLGQLMSADTPVAVGAGPPSAPIGPERENVPRGAVPGPGEGVDARQSAKS